MPKSINRKLAEVLVPSTTALKESVLDDISAGVTPYATLDDLPTSNLTLGDQAFVTSNQRLYLSNGSGWYNVAKFNATPNLTISPSGAITLATDGSTPTVITLTGTDSDNADANLIYTAELDGNFAGLATLSQDSSVFTITPLAEGVATTTSSTLTFKVSDGISFGSGTTEFSLTFGPNWSTPTESKLTASDAQATDYFGDAVAISSDGNYAIVGARGEDTGALSSGAAYIYVRSGSTWAQQAKIQMHRYMIILEIQHQSTLMVLMLLLVLALMLCMSLKGQDQLGPKKVKYKDLILLGVMVLVEKYQLVATVLML